MSEVETTPKTNILSSTFDVLLAKEGETIATTEARKAVLVSCLATAVGTSMYTRKRAEEGKKAILKVLF